MEFTDVDALPSVMRLLVDSGVTILRTSHPGLEEVYFEYMDRVRNPASAQGLASSALNG